MSVGMGMSGCLTRPQPTPCRNTIGLVRDSSLGVAASSEGKPNPGLARAGPDDGCRTQNVRPCAPCAILVTPTVLVLATDRGVMDRSFNRNHDQQQTQIRSVGKQTMMQRQRQMPGV